MTDAVKLLTEADVGTLYRIALQNGRVAFETVLNERGLIAPEPDPKEAAYKAYLDRLEPGCAGVDMKFTFCAGYDAGERNAARAPLTREMVRESVEENCVVSVTIDTEALHAALTKEQS